MKVLLVGNGDDSKGSAQCLIELACMLKLHYSYDVIVINPYYNKLNEQCNEYGIENYSLGFQEMICKKNSGNLRFMLKFVAKYSRYIICNLMAMRAANKIDFSGVDIVHSNTTAVDFGVKLAKKLDKPHVWHIREFGKDDFNFFYFHVNIPKFINENSDRIIAISDVILNSWKSRGINSKKINRIYDGVLGNNFIATRQEPKDSMQIRIAFCGGITPEKGQHQLIEALSELSANEKSQLLVDFFGSGKEEYIKELKSLVKEKGLDNLITFKGYTTNIHAELANYDVGVVCSKSEGFGRVTVEYMLSGMCVIASDSGANPELLKNSEYGLLYKSGDIKSLADNLRTIISDRNLITEFGIKSKQYAFDNYRLENNVYRIAEVYVNILQSKKKETNPMYP